VRGASNNAMHELGAPRRSRLVDSERREATMTIRSLSYNLTLQCGCIVYVSTHPRTRIAHTRVIQTRGQQCRVRPHEAGCRLYLWELLPDPVYRPDPSWADTIEDSRWTT
jgi:hypothetical protein